MIVPQGITYCLNRRQMNALGYTSTPNATPFQNHVPAGCLQLCTPQSYTDMKLYQWRECDSTYTTKEIPVCCIKYWYEFSNTGITVSDEPSPFTTTTEDPKQNLSYIQLQQAHFSHSLHFSLSPLDNIYSSLLKYLLINKKNLLHWKLHWLHHQENIYIYPSWCLQWMLQPQDSYEIYQADKMLPYHTQPSRQHYGYTINAIHTLTSTPKLVQIT